MDEIEQGATPYKVGKRVGSRAKVKNATKITEGDLEFDSKLEYNCYKLLQESAIEFIFKPEKVVIVPGFETDVLDHTEENLKILRSMVREWAPDKDYIKRKGMNKAQEKLYRAECKRMQSSVKRKFNAENRKVIRKKKILPVTWSPDFLIPRFGLYVEAKGFANDSFPIKFKAARFQFGPKYAAVEVGSKKEMEDLIIYLRMNNYEMERN